MTPSITVKVCYRSSGNPASDIPVRLDFDGFWKGGHTDRVFTNSDGVAHFSNAEPRRGTIFVDGKTVFKGYIEAYNTFHI